MAEERDVLGVSGARYPCQLVVMVTVETDEAVRLTSDVTGRSMSDILRETIAAGLPIVAGRVKRSRGMLAAALEGAREDAPAA